MNAMLTAGALIAFVAPATAADSLPLGNWARGDGNARVSIERCGAAICAVNTWIKDTSDGEQVGHKLVMNLKPTGPGKLAGTAFDPQRDRTYNLTIDFGAARMSTRGCIIGILCKTVSWTKAP